MAKCGFCGSSILLGGVTSGGQRFCNQRCLTNAYALSVSKQIPPDVIDRQMEEVFRGNCPKCRGPGPVDVHKVHRVWSAVVLTRWSTASQVSCRSCGLKSQAGAALFSAALGWWGFPWGLILTPVQITRNVIGMWGGSGASGPSADLRKLILASIATQALRKQQQEQRPQGPPPPPASK